MATKPKRTLYVKEREMKVVIVDFLSTAKSKRVILATVSAFIVAAGHEYFGFDADTTTKLTALAASLIIGDSLRPTAKVNNG